MADHMNAARMLIAGGDPEKLAAYLDTVRKAGFADGIKQAALVCGESSEKAFDEFMEQTDRTSCTLLSEESHTAEACEEAILALLGLEAPLDVPRTRGKACMHAKPEPPPNPEVRDITGMATFKQV